MVYIILLAGLIVGLPVAFAILAALFYFMAVGDFPYALRLVATQMYGGMKSFPLLAIPLFILAGELMNESGITSRIIAFTTVLVGRFRAGLAMVNIWASVVFAGLSGSAVADTSALGRVFIPEMEKTRLPAGFCCSHHRSIFRNRSDHSAEHSGHHLRPDGDRCFGARSVSWRDRTRPAPCHPSVDLRHGVCWAL